MGRRKFYLLLLIPIKHTSTIHHSVLDWNEEEEKNTNSVCSFIESTTFSHWLSDPFGVIVFDSTKASTELGSYFAFLQLPF